MRRFLLAVIAIVAVAAAAFFWVTEPDRLALASLPGHTPDPENGKLIFNVGGCASCHAAEGASDEARLVLAGGQALETPFGSIEVPNISPDRAHGIGGWSVADLANALNGVAPDGSYYVPAFPWPSYRNMKLEDVIDLKAYLDTLPPSDQANGEGGLPFPFSWRRPIGVWQRFILPDSPAEPAGADAVVARGHYLTVALGHCGECHTPRNVLFAPDNARWLAGGPSPDGDGTVPNITPSSEGIGDWSASDISYLLSSGFTPDFDSVGGEMTSVVTNWAEVPAEDREAVAAYLKAIPALP